jgi:hypothetical protein
MMRVGLSGKAALELGFEGSGELSPVTGIDCRERE